MTDVLAFALRTAELLGPVFPCAPRSKEPFGSLAPHGCHSATRAPALIRSWFRSGSTLNVALALGGGLFALDIDPRHDGDSELARLEREQGSLALTPRQLTGGGGLHYLLRIPANVRLRNGAIASGVEIKTDGGYIIIAPSVHPSGGVYAWDVGALPSETPIAEAPGWLVDLARGQDRRDCGTATGPAAASFVGVAFAAAGLLRSGVSPSGAAMVRCPWYLEHSDGRGDGHDLSTVILPPTDSARLGAFRCAHAHCHERRTGVALAALPVEALETAARMFPTLASLAAKWISEHEAP